MSRQTILLREITVRKPGTKTGKMKIKYVIPEEIFFKIAKGVKNNEKTLND